MYISPLERYRRRRLERGAGVLLVALCVGARGAGPSTVAPESGEGSSRHRQIATMPGREEGATVAGAIADLGSDNYAKRELAERFLLQQAPGQLPVIEAAFDREPDSEAAMRLARVALHLFLKQRTAFEGRASLLGISLKLEVLHIGPRDSEVRAAVAVAEVQPGFPAAEMLRAGDRIVAIDKEAFPVDMSIESFRRHVNAAWPGSTLQLTVLRGKAQLEIPVKLAGVPDEGVMAIGDYVRARTLAGKMYLDQLRAAREAPLVIHSAEDAAVGIPAESKL